MLSQLTLSDATANAEGDSAQNPIAPPARESLQEQTVSGCARRSVKAAFSRGRR